MLAYRNESIQENKRTRGTNTRQPQKRADGLRTYLEPSQSVRVHKVCAPVSFAQTDSSVCALRAAQTDRQQPAENVLKPFLIWRHYLLSHLKFSWENVFEHSKLRNPLSLCFEENFIKKTTKKLARQEKKRKNVCLGFSTNDLWVLWYHIFESDGPKIRMQFLDMHYVLPRFPSVFSWCIT